MKNDCQQDWYAPLNRAEPQAEQQEAVKRRGMPLGLRIVLGVMLIVGLIAGSSLFFSEPAPPQKSEARGESRGDSGFNNILPDEVPELIMPEDWKDYFNSYFTVEDSGSAESRIPSAGYTGEWQLELTPSGDRELPLQEIYRDCVESIVSIRTFANNHFGYYWGTGIILSADGLILTNAHLVLGCDRASVSLYDDTPYDAKLIGADQTSDIAVLKIEAEGLKPAVFGDSERLSVGERVAAIGNPLGEEFRATLTDGIVSAIDRGVSYDGHSMNLIQTDAAINEGNSGGALLNMYGQVVGVTNMKMMSNYSSIEGIGFAIPSATVRAIANALIRDGEVRGRPAIGVTVGAVSAEAADFYELPEGLYVSAVTEGSDAQKKGIREGDIITAVNGEPARSTEDIVKVRDALQVGDSITFTVWRDGSSEDIEVEIIDFIDIY